MKNINDRIKYLITSKGFNKSSFAKKIGVDSTKIQNIVQGRNVGTKEAPQYKKNPPHYDVIVKILTSFDDVDAYWLLIDNYKETNTYKNRKTENNKCTTDDMQSKTTEELLLEIEKLQNEIKELKIDKIHLVRLLNRHISEEK